MFASATPPSAGMTPNQVRGAYGLGSYTGGTLSNGISAFPFSTAIQGDGSGQTIAIVDAYDYPTALNDLTVFSTTFGLPVLADGSTGTPAGPWFKKVNQSGGTSLPQPDMPGGWGGESSLDIEWAHAMAPMANIILFEATDPSPQNMFAAVKSAAATRGVVAVSMSWGMSESPGERTLDAILTTPPGHVGGSATVGGPGIRGGVTFLASAGDSGPYEAYTSIVMPAYPASSPNVVAVGGTTLAVTGTDPTFTWVSESAWGEGPASGPNRDGGGGGISTYESQPTYQKTTVAKYSTTQRTYPDVAAVADWANPGVVMYDSYDFGTTTPWDVNGGTSLACPLWAGMIAVADQGRAIVGVGSLDGVSETLPALYGVPATDFHDIITGATGDVPPVTPVSYAAGLGYDLTTGRGTPIANLLIPDLCPKLAISASPLTPLPFPPLTLPTTTIGTAGAWVSVTVSGRLLGTTFPVTVTPPVGCEIWWIGVPGFTTQPISLPPDANGNLSTDVYARISASALANVNGNLTLDDTLGSRLTQSVAVVGTVISTPLPAPVVTDIYPDYGPAAGGTTVTITGANLGGATSVKFGNTPATIVTDTAGQMVVTSPAGTGMVHVTVTTVNGTSATSQADLFTYGSAPLLDPSKTYLALPSTTQGTAGAALNFTLTGTGLVGGENATIIAPTGCEVSLSGSSGFGSQLTLSPDATGNLSAVIYVRISASAIANVTGSIRIADTFHLALDKYIVVSGIVQPVIASPSVTGISPASGATVGGTQVIIRGTNLAAVTAVKFGNTAAKILSAAPTQVVVLSPAGSGTVDVTVTTVKGTSATSTADRFTYIANPVLKVSTTLLTLSGTSLGTAGAASGFTVSGTGLGSTDTITLTAPTGSEISQSIASGYTNTLQLRPDSNGTLAATVYIRIAASATKNVGGYLVITDALHSNLNQSIPASGTVRQGSLYPTIAGISPSSGPRAGGTLVTIRGTNLNGATAVRFGGVLARIVSDTATQMVVMSPAGAGGAVDITVTTAVGTTTLSTADRFTYLPVPSPIVPTPVAARSLFQPLSSAAIATLYGVKRS